MPKKILVVAGSARKNGNSSILCDEFIKGAKTNHFDIEKIYLSDLNIGFCTGCGACNTTKKCVLKDDMAELLAKVSKADIIVLASPVYFYSISGLIKNFIDRLLPKYKELTAKEFYFILTAAENDMGAVERAIECFRGLTDCLDGAVEKGIVYGIGAWQIGDIKNSKAMNAAFNFGKNA